MQGADDANQKVSDISVYRMMAIIPIVLSIDLLLLIFVPIYLYLIYRDKLSYENTTIKNIVSMKNCFDTYINTEIKDIEKMQYSTYNGPYELGTKYYGQYQSNREMIIAVDVIVILFAIFVFLTLWMILLVICKHSSCEILMKYN